MEIGIRGQITERFTKAIDQLGSDRPAIQLGGIYALKAIADDARSFHYPVVEILTAYVREKARWGDDYEAESSHRRRRAPADIQAIRNVLGRRREMPADPVDLTDTDLRGAELEFADLSGAGFYHSHLDGAAFEESKLERANFRRACLRDAQFIRCNFGGSAFEGADLRKKEFVLCDLSKGDFTEANLEETDFTDSTLQGADLRGAVGVTALQLGLAVISEATKLPALSGQQKAKRPDEGTRATGGQKQKSEAILSIDASRLWHVLPLVAGILPSGAPFLSRFFTARPSSAATGTAVPEAAATSGSS